MSEIVAALVATSPAELLAVLLAIAYLLLAIRQSLWCWAAAIGSTSIYVVLMFQAQLYMESALQLFYIAIALYGWWHWRHPGVASGSVEATSATRLHSMAGLEQQQVAAEAAPTRKGRATRRTSLPVTTWPLRHHALATILVLLLSAASGWLLARHTDAALPYLDSFTTWGAVLATWMVARKLLENWYYWFVIDSAAIWLYLQRGLHLTALLFAMYLVLIVIGYLAWRRSMRYDGTAERAAGHA